MRQLNDPFFAIIVHNLCIKYIPQLPTSGISTIEYIPKVRMFKEIIIFSNNKRRLCIFTDAYKMHNTCRLSNLIVV